MSFISRIAIGITLGCVVLGHGVDIRAQAPATEPTAGPTSGPSTEQMISEMHDGLAEVGTVLGLADDEKTKVDALEKKFAEQIKADPAKTHGRDFEEASMKQYREVLNPEHQKKFDEMMEQSRKMALKFKTQSNLRQIGMAGMLYSNENNQKLAPDLGTLAGAEVLDAKAYLTGDSKTEAPADWDKMDAKAKADWVNKNTDFVYMGASLKPNPDGAIVLVYIKPELAIDGNNFLMADGSVQTKTAEESKAIIADLTAGKNPPPSMK